MRTELLQRERYVPLNLAERNMDKNAVAFCEEFLNPVDASPRLVMGRNQYAESIAENCIVDGFIDDFTQDAKFYGKPVFKTCDIPQNSLVVSATLLRPLTAKKCLDKYGIRHLDYFAFDRYSSLSLKPVSFWQNFQIDFKNNRKKYDWLHDRLQDPESKTTLTRLLNFRLSANLNHMNGFVDKQDRQYFEDFLNLSPDGETFIDVGGFEGETSVEFMKHCPEFNEIHFFEPEVNNLDIAKQQFGHTNRIHYYCLGLSDTRAICSFSPDGSSSKMTSFGETTIHVNSLDDVLPGSTKPTFIKMDIEGAEKQALTGARKTITTHRPRLAVCVYHKGDDLWKIPHQVLSYHPDYQIYLRHYTEGVTETVMFFLDTQR